MGKLFPRVSVWGHPAQKESGSNGPRQERESQEAQKTAKFKVCRPPFQPRLQTRVIVFPQIPSKSLADALVFCHFAQKAARGTEWKPKPRPAGSLTTHPSIRLDLMHTCNPQGACRAPRRGSAFVSVFSNIPEFLLTTCQSYLPV